MKQAAYYRVRTMDEALELAAGTDIEIIAGGTDLMVQREDRIKDPAGLVDITGIGDLSGIRSGEEGLYIGACTTIAEIAEASANVPNCLRQGAKSIGSPQIRNLATLGGNICNASPCGDTLAPLFVLQAEFILTSLDGERRIPASDYFTAPKRTVRMHGEILTGIFLPGDYSGAFSAFRMIGKREGQAISQVNGAVCCTITKDSAPAVGTVRAAAGSVAPTPVRLPSAETYLSGRTRESIDRKHLSQAVKADIRPISDVRSTEAYRFAVAGQLIADAVFEILDRENKHED